MGKASGSRSKKVPIAKGLRAERMNRSRLLSAMSGSAHVGKLSRSCLHITANRSSVIPASAIATRFPCPRFTSVSPKPRSQGSAASA